MTSATDLTKRPARWLHRCSLFATTVIFVGGCSLQLLDRTECESDEQCAAAVGAGSSCLAEGFCAAVVEGAELLCQTTADCHARTGFGEACIGATEDEMGSCDSIPTNSRCLTNSVPGDLLTGNNTDRVVVGVISDRSITAHLDRDEAISLAVSEINESGGIDGNPLGLIVCDVQSGPGNPYGDGLTRPDAAIESARWLVQDVGVAGILGPYTSADAELVYAEVINDEALRGRAILISPSATDPAITELDVTTTPSNSNPGVFWRTAASGTEQVGPLVDAMEAQAVTNVAVIREQSPFAGTFMATGQSLAESFSEGWNGGIEQFTYGADKGSERDEKVREVGALLAAGEVDAVLFIGPIGDSRAFLTLATDSAEYGDDVPLFFPDSGAVDEIFDGISDPRLFDNITAVRPIPRPGFVLDNFVASFTARTGTDPLRSTFTAHAYDAAWLLSLSLVFATAEGEDAAAETESGYPVIAGGDVARGLRNTGAGTMLEFRPSEWTTGVSQFSQGRTVDVVGAASDYNWDFSIEEAPGMVEVVIGTDAGTFAPQ